MNKLPVASHTLFVELLKTNGYDHPYDFSAGIAAIFIIELFEFVFFYEEIKQGLL